MSLIAVLTLLSIVNLANSNPSQCEFDNANNCDCVPYFGQPNKYGDIICNPIDGTIHSFNISGGNYITADKLLFQVDGFDLTIPANALSAFESIDQLSFSQSEETDRPFALRLDPDAFSGVRVKKFDTFRFSNLLPIPQAIKQLGNNGLQTLTIAAGGDKASLNVSDFRGFRLTGLLITNSTLQINEDTFDGLQNTLFFLSIRNAGLTKFPDAITVLKRLRILDLTGNDMQEYPQSAFASFKHLRNLLIAENNLQSAIESKAFENFPTTVKRAIFRNNKLTTVPTNLLNILPDLNFLSLGFNNIESIKIGDFPDKNGLKQLILGGNPITSIENGSLSNLTSVNILSLHSAKLQSIDLSNLEGMNSLASLDLGGQRTLQNVTISNLDKVPPQLNQLVLSETNITTLSSTFKNLLDHPYFNIIDISNDFNFQCDENLKWMASYVLCVPSRIFADGAACQNLQDRPSLADYLKKLVPDACKKS